MVGLVGVIEASPALLPNPTAEAQVAPPQLHCVLTQQQVQPFEGKQDPPLCRQVGLANETSPPERISFHTRDHKQANQALPWKASA